VSPAGVVESPLQLLLEQLRIHRLDQVSNRSARESGDDPLRRRLVLRVASSSSSTTRTRPRARRFFDHLRAQVFVLVGARPSRFISLATVRTTAAWIRAAR